MSQQENTQVNMMIMQSVIKQQQEKIGELHTAYYEMCAKEQLYVQSIQELERKIAELDAPAEEVRETEEGQTSNYAPVRASEFKPE